MRERVIRMAWFSEELTGWGLSAPDAALEALAIDADVDVSSVGAPDVYDWDAPDALGTTGARRGDEHSAGALEGEGA